MPGAVIGAERGLRAFGYAGQPLHPLRPGDEGLRIAQTTVDGFAPDADHAADIGRAALAALDLDRLDAGLLQLRQQLQRVQTGRFLDGVIGMPGNLVASLADYRLAGFFSGIELVDQHVVEAALRTVRGFDPTHRACGAAGSAGIGRFTGGV